MASDNLLVGLIVATDLKAEGVGFNEQELLTLHNPTGTLGLTGEHTDAVTLLAEVKYMVDDGAEEYGAIGPFIAALNVGPFVKDILRVMVNQYERALIAIHEEGDTSKKTSSVLVVGKVTTHRHIQRVDEDHTRLGGQVVNGADKRLEILLNVQRQKFLGQMNKARVVQWNGVRHAVHSVYEVGAFPLSLDVENVYSLGDKVGI